MRAHQAIYPVRTLCRVLGVSPSGYYAYVKRPPSRRAVEDAGLLERIEHFHARSRGTYGAPRIHRDLVEEDEVQVGIRRVVGWSMANHLRTELVLTALEMALQQRQLVDVIHHSDQGCQYTSYAFGKRCRQAGVRPSMGSVGDAYDNALCESFFATLECELLDRRRFRSQTEARMAVFDFVEGWYNPKRRHSALHYFSPLEFERINQTPMRASASPSTEADQLHQAQRP